VWFVVVVAVGGLSVAALAPARPSGQSSDPVLRAITRAVRNGALDRLQAATYRQTYAAAVAEVGRLRRLRARELQAAIAIVRGIAARRALDASRMTMEF
jgi:hypothetical protein